MTGPDARCQSPSSNAAPSVLDQLGAIKPQPRVDPLGYFQCRDGNDVEIDALHSAPAGSSRLARCKVAGFKV